MTVKDFSSRELSRPYAGTLLEVTTNAAYVTLWAHKPRYNAAGKLQKERGTIVTNRFPREDWPGLYEMAQSGFFPWPIDSEPDLTAYPGSSKADLDNRKEVLKAFEFYSEKYEAKNEPEPVIEPVVIPEPEVKLPEPATVPESTYEIRCEICGFVPTKESKNGKPRSEKQRLHSVNFHKQNTHK